MKSNTAREARSLAPSTRQVSIAMARRKKVASSSSSPAATQAPPNTPGEGEGQGQGRPPAATAPARRQPVVLSRPTPSRGARCAEVAGGTAADCAAVCCCCPCGLVGLVVLAVVRLPAGLCRQAYLRRRKRLGAAAKRKKCDATAGDGAPVVGLLEPRVGAAEDDVVFGGSGDDVVFGLLGWPAEKSPSREVSEMEEEMWAQFYGGGFWRSPSQRET